MRRGGRILIILGLVLGLVTAGGTFFMLANQQPAGPALREVVVAIQPIPNRSEIIAEALGKQLWPEPIPVDAFEKIEDVAGKLSLQQVYPGQIILKPMIIDKTQVKDTRSNASFLIPQGKVAVAYAINTQNGVAGALQSGDYIDMILTLAPSVPPTTTTTTTTRTTTTAPVTGLEGLEVTQMFLQDVLVLQVGAWPVAGAEANAAAGSGIVTFIMDRQDAMALKAASENGSIWFLLRPAGDHKLVTTEAVTLQYLNRRFNFNLTPGRQ